MNKIIYLSLFLLCGQVLAAEQNLKTELEARNGFNPRASHWITNFGFESLKYPTEYSFVGKKETYRPNDIELYGTRLGLGYEFHLGKGFHTATKIDGYYYGSLFNSEKTASPEFKSVTVSSRKDMTSLFGADISQTLSFLFDMKTKNPFLDQWTYLTVEPYLEAGLGMASSINRRNYKTDTGVCTDCVQEEYRARIRDEISTTKLALGINFISTSGYFLYLKGTQYLFDITKRKIDEYVKQDDVAGVQSTRESTQDNSSKPIMVYAIGGGYKF